MLRVKRLEVSLSLPSWTTRWDLQRYRRFDHVLGETTGNSRALANNMIPLLNIEQFIPSIYNIHLCIHYSTLRQITQVLPRVEIIAYP